MYKIVGADGQEYGPISVEQIGAWIKEGRANGQTQVRPESATEWKPLDSYPELAAFLGAPPPGNPPTISPISPYSTTGFARTTHPLAIAGLALGIFSMTIGLCCCYGFPFNAVGIVLSGIALAQIKKEPGRFTGAGMAIAGIVLSVLSILVGIGLFAAGVAFHGMNTLRQFRNL